ncbi:MAG TPA: four helix bundle protein [Candidatus Omnitrophica bacterium]|nr:MAG: four helix bundle protein [Omnitrophica WOR_2 bacterium GWA2_45_18]OGX19770.1 MAG: four helix bundle protein [Omnitrophica WOR_2 bacterium GWC2_45_7]HBR14261.1 four helix bundle protein [Candidatus Omnitrophota bacterium]
MKGNGFNFEDLEVWKKSVDFCTDIIDLTEVINTDRRHYRLVEQIESSAASISANISEGKGRYSKKEFVRSLYVARGSLYETITFLTIFYKKQWINDVQFNALKTRGIEIGKMISGLASSIKETID